MAGNVNVPSKRMVGYADRMSVAPGETIRFFVNCDGVTRYGAGLVRLYSGDLHPSGAGFREQEVAAPFQGHYGGRGQEIRAGSHLCIDSGGFPALDSFTLATWILPTMAGCARQVIMGRFDAPSHAGFALVLDDSGALALEIGEGDGRVETLSTCVPLCNNRWYRISVSFDGTNGEARVVQTPMANNEGLRETIEQRVFATRPQATPATRFMIAACEGTPANGRPAATGFFNGKIEAPRVCDRPLSPERIAALDTAHREPLHFRDDGLVRHGISRVRSPRPG